MFSQSSMQEKWIKTMQDCGAYWHHDGNLKRPYALLTSGKISNFYANCSAITRRPNLLHDAARNLMERVYALDEKCMPDAYVGSAYGAITLAYELARQDGDFRGGNTEAWFTAKGDDDTMKLDRFEFGPHIKSVIMVEDVITTFKTTRNSIKTLTEKAAGTGAAILPYVLAMVNRTGKKEIDGFEIISLIEVSNALMWEEGQNPFLGKGPERVEPVRPKQNWAALTAEYPS
jgi:orotate phosphoribosyltransferase